jgi:hypothetical protein
MTVVMAETCSIIMQNNKWIFDYNSLKTIQLMAQGDVSTLDENFNVRLLWVGMSQMNMRRKTFT